MSLTSKQVDELRAYAKDRKGELAKMINDVANTIEMLSAKLHASQMERSSQYYHGGWIPCSERLPEHDGELYLVTDYCEQINRRRIHISYCYVNREGFWSDVPIGYKVIAWMPLPEPYKEKQDE